MKKRILACLISAAMTMGLAACSGGNGSPSSAPPAPASDSSAASAPEAPPAQETVKLRASLYSDGQNMNETQKSVFEAFTAEHPNIVPEFQFITSETGNWNGYLMKIQTMIASGEAPDVACLGLEGVAMMAMKDLALPIDDYLEAHKDEYDPVLANIDQSLQDIFIVDGKRYSIPYEANSVVTHIRKDRFAEAGVELPGADWTLDDFKAMCEKLSDPANGKYAFGVPTNFFCLSAWLYANGGAPLNDDWTAPTINSPEVVEVFQFFQDAIHQHQWAPQPEPSISDVELIVQGKTAMGWWGRWTSNDYAASDVSDVFVQTMPGMKNGHTSCAGSAGFVVMKSTKHPEEAKALACWTAKQDYVNTFMKTGSLPANSAYGAEICAADPTIDNWKVMYDIYEGKTWRRSQDPPEYADLGFIYQKYMDIIYANQMPAQEALDQAQAEIEQLFATSDFRKEQKDLDVIASLFKN